MSMLSVSTTVRNGFNKAIRAQATSKSPSSMRVSQTQSAALGQGIKNPDGSEMHAGDVAVLYEGVRAAEGRPRPDRQFTLAAD
jgi:hypothetical protein